MAGGRYGGRSPHDPGEDPRPARVCKEHEGSLEPECEHRQVRTPGSRLRKRPCAGQGRGGTRRPGSGSYLHCEPAGARAGRGPGFPQVLFLMCNWPKGSSCSKPDTTPQWVSALGEESLFLSMVLPPPLPASGLLKRTFGAQTPLLPSVVPRPQGAGAVRGDGGIRP